MHQTLHNTGVAEGKRERSRREKRAQREKERKRAGAPLVFISEQEGIIVEERSAIKINGQ